MNEIICPNCKKAFKVDEAGFADILNQVRTQEFERELTKRETQLKEEKANAIKLAEEKVKNLLKDEISAKERDFLKLNAAKDNEITELNSRLRAFETEKALALKEALSEVEKERDKIANELATEKKLKLSDIDSLELRYKEKLANELKIKDDQLKVKDELIERYKDMKAKLSTKMLGETLEQHCEIEFNKLRATAFPQAYFEKDNDAKSGSKGDYIYRESDSPGNEIISIMFEMKNEADDTAVKKKNEDFFKELDKDRTEKKCEYAVMVSLLEPDSELYNSGIVDVSHRYNKMYVIRPQFFIPMITLLRNAAMNSLKYKAELALVRSQNIDITNFENKLNEFKDGFAYNYRLASTKFKTAIEEIDKTIDHLLKIKDNLLGSENNLRLANNKADEITIKKLTRGNPTMTKMFQDVSDKEKDV